MKIIFVKEYTDHKLMGVPMVIDMGQKGEVLDEEKGTVLLTEGMAWAVELNSVPSEYYVRLVS